jgi:hypothetical protein
MKLFKCGCNRHNTWQKDFSYDSDMKLRYENMLKLLPSSSSPDKNSFSSVLDLGCGRQYLRELLPENINYTGVDLYSHISDTIVCDFNKKQFIKVIGKPYDLVVCAGLFEYIYNVKWLIKKIADVSGRYILCSYNFDEFTRSHADIWTKRLLSQKTMFDLFYKNECSLIAYSIDPIKPYPNKTGYFCFEKKKEDNKI